MGIGFVFGRFFSIGLRGIILIFDLRLNLDFSFELVFILSNHFQHLSNFLSNPVGSVVKYTVDGLGILAFLIFFVIVWINAGILDKGDLLSDVVTKLLYFPVDIFKLNLLNAFQITVQKTIKHFFAFLLLNSLLSVKF